MSSLGKHYAFEYIWDIRTHCNFMKEKIKNVGFGLVFLFSKFLYFTGSVPLMLKMLPFNSYHQIKLLPLSLAHNMKVMSGAY